MAKYYNSHTFFFRVIQIHKVDNYCKPQRDKNINYFQ